MLVLSWMSAHLAYGVLLLLLFVPPQAVGPRFYRLNLGIASALLAIALAVERFLLPAPMSSAAGVPQSWWVAAFCLALAVAGASLASWGVGRSWFRVLIVVAAASAALALSLEGITLAEDASRVELAALAYLLGGYSSALLLGSVLVGMNLGHWYLVVLDMPFRHLRRFSLVFALAVLLKLIAVGLTMFFFGRAFPEIVASTTANFVTGNALFFWARVVMGLVVPGILAVMIWSTVRIRSNQSATGLLYVAVVFVLFGELFAKYLLAVSRLPL